MKILVTGGGGFLGGHLCRGLLEKGHQVRVLARQRYPELEQLGVELIQGDIQSLESCVSACRGVDAIFHTASKVAMWGRWEDFYQTNTIGTKNMLQAASRAGVARFIYTSTPSVVFSDHDHINAGPDTAYPPLERFQSLYAKSKALAEQEVLKAHHPPSLLTVAIRPHLIFGPGDKNIIPRLIQKARRGRLLQVGEGNNLVDVIHVKNAVHAHLCALERLSPDSPIGGKAYFVGQEEPVSLWPFIESILAHYQLSPPNKSISFKRAYRLGALFEKLFRFFHWYDREPPMTRFVAMQLAKSHYFDHKPAQEELGYQPQILLPQCLDDLPKEL